MPTLLQINVSSNYGSTGKIAEQIGLLVQEQGWNSYIAHGSRYINPSNLNTIQINNKLDEYIHGGWYSLLQDKHGLGSINATKRLINKIKNDIKPDIIHLHNIHGYFLNYEILFDFLSKENIPVVWTLHDCWSFTGHCSHFDYEGCSKWKNLCSACPLLKAYPKSLFHDNSQNNYLLKKKCFTALSEKLTIIPVSNWLENLLKESFFKNCHIQTIHNGIDLNIFRPQPTDSILEKYNLKGKTVLLGVAAPWTQRKGLSDFFKMRSILNENYAIIMVGLSKKQIENLPNGIIGIQRTQNVHELTQIYSSADIFINTTYEDNYPTVNLEAIACGTPVITYNTGGSPESISPLTGRIVEKGNINKVIESIHELEQFDRKQLKEDCLKDAAVHFDNVQCFNKYIELYKNILNQQHPL